MTKQEHNEESISLVGTLEEVGSILLQGLKGDFSCVDL